MKIEILAIFEELRIPVRLVSCHLFLFSFSSAFFFTYLFELGEGKIVMIPHLCKGELIGL